VGQHRAEAHVVTCYKSKSSDARPWGWVQRVATTLTDTNIGVWMRGPTRGTRQSWDEESRHEAIVVESIYSTRANTASTVTSNSLLRTSLSSTTGWPHRPLSNPWVGVCEFLALLSSMSCLFPCSRLACHCAVRNRVHQDAHGLIQDLWQYFPL